MTRPVLLNNNAHAALRIHTGHSAALGDQLMSALAVPDEFRTLQSHYPIVFQKSADGTQFQPTVLFGLQEGENLFLTEQGWDALSVPMSVERQPFLIGTDGEQLLVHVDLDSPRIAGPSEGEAVFLPHGGQSDYLERINSLLLALHDGMAQAQRLSTALQALQLLESFVLDVELNDGSQGRLAGYYTVNEERLAALTGDLLDGLQREGHLLPIYMTLASLGRFRDLIERRNQRLPASA